MIIVHHLNNSRSQRVLWLLEELGVTYDIKFYDRNEMGLAPPELKKIHPLGKSPVITDGDVVVAESAVILNYIIDRYGQGKLRPKDYTNDRLRYDYWMHYSEGSAMSPLLLSLIFSRMPKQPMPVFVRPIVKEIAKKALKTFIEPQVKLHLDFMEAELSKSEWFAGKDFSAADIQMSFPVEGGEARGGLGMRMKLTAFLEKIHARPAYKKALERGGPYELMD